MSTYIEIWSINCQPKSVHIRGLPMKKLPGNVSIEKTYRDSDREALLRRIRELEIELRKTEMARDAYDEMIHLAEQYYNLPIRKKSVAK